MTASNFMREIWLGGGLAVEPHLDGGVPHLFDQVIAEVGHVVLEPEAVSEQVELAAQLVAALEEGHLMAPGVGLQRGLQSGRAAADDRHLFNAAGGRELLFVEVAAIGRIHRADEIPGGGLVIQYGVGNGFAHGAVAAVVAADAGADVVRPAGPGLVGPLLVGDPLTAHEHIVRFAGGDDLLGQLRGVDAAHDAHGNLDPGLFHLLGHGRIMAMGDKAGGMHEAAGPGVKTGSGGDVDQVRQVLQLLDVIDSVLDLDAARGHLRAAHPQLDEDVAAHLLAHALQHHTREFDAVFPAAARGRRCGC